MTTNKKYSILYKKQVFYSIAFVLTVLGVYVAKIIEDHYKIVASGIVGIALLYLVWITYVLPKNTTSKFVELEDLEFPRDLYYLLYGLFPPMIIFWAGNLIVDAIRYILNQYVAK